MLICVADLHSHPCCIHRALLLIVVVSDIKNACFQRFPDYASLTKACTTLRSTVALRKKKVISV